MLLNDLQFSNINILIGYEISEQDLFTRLRQERTKEYAIFNYPEKDKSVMQQINWVNDMFSTTWLDDCLQIFIFTISPYILKAINGYIRQHKLENSCKYFNIYNTIEDYGKEDSKLYGLCHDIYTNDSNNDNK